MFKLRRFRQCLVGSFRCVYYLNRDLDGVLFLLSTALFLIGCTHDDDDLSLVYDSCESNNVKIHEYMNMYTVKIYILNVLIQIMKCTDDIFS